MVAPTDPVLSTDGIRFMRTVTYAGANFGTVDLTADRKALDAALAHAQFLLIALSAFVIAVVAAIGYLSANQVSKPLRRLRVAIDEAADGNIAFRLSHRRNDELGTLFDAFNRLMREMEDRAPTGPVADAQAMLRTRIAPTATTGKREAA